MKPEILLKNILSEILLQTVFKTLHFYLSPNFHILIKHFIKISPTIMRNIHNIPGIDNTNIKHEMIFPKTFLPINSSMTNFFKEFKNDILLLAASQVIQITINNVIIISIINNKATNDSIHLLPINPFLKLIKIVFCKYNI